MAVRLCSRPSALLAGVVLCALGGINLDSASAQTIHRFVASITPAQNIPPSAGSSAIGAGTFVVNTATNTLSYRIIVAGLTSQETIAAIHSSHPGHEDPNAHTTIALGPVKVGTWNYPESLESSILNGDLYIDIHSANFPNGEIRGQVQTHIAELDGLQAVPPTPSTATGWGAFMIDTTANTLRYHIETTGVTGETAAHIRGPAVHGQIGPILHTLPSGAVKTGTWVYPQFREHDLLRGLAYINITSAAFPDGMIRGQIVNALIPIDGQQEVPAVNSTGVGVGFVSLADGTDTLSFDIRRTALNAAESNAHIHGYAARGANGPVRLPLSPGDRKLGSWTYPSADELSIINGLSYINIHTTANPGGEIRGQIEFGPVPCRADVNGDNVVSSQDFFDFLTPFFAGNADFNGDSSTNSQDFFDFLAVFFEPC